MFFFNTSQKDGLKKVTKKILISSFVKTDVDVNLLKLLLLIIDARENKLRYFFLANSFGLVYFNGKYLKFRMWQHKVFHLTLLPLQKNIRQS